ENRNNIYKLNNNSLHQTSINSIWFRLLQLYFLYTIICAANFGDVTAGLHAKYILMIGEKQLLLYLISQLLAGTDLRKDYEINYARKNKSGLTFDLPRISKLALVHLTEGCAVPFTEAELMHDRCC
ncbi:hypothetical protein ACJX0J_021102, partial [Zea mays]